jgi:hypothetical protein
MQFGREAVQLRAHVETTGVINVALFAINNDYTRTSIRKQDFRFARKKSRATRSRTPIQFRISISRPVTKPFRRSKKDFPALTIFVSAFYRARALPLADGAIYNFSVRGESRLSTRRS